MRRAIEGDKDSGQRGLLLLLPLLGQVIELLSWLARDNQSSGRFASPAPSVGGEYAVRYSVLARDETLRPKVAAACATQPLASRPIQQNVLLYQDANDHADRAGLDGEAGAKWSLSEDHVSAVE
jgi:hypothetical protein